MKKLGSVRKKVYVTEQPYTLTKKNFFQPNHRHTSNGRKHNKIYLFVIFVIKKDKISYHIIIL